ncbi:MAG: glycosyltransferase family 4 protein [Roseiflexaceae bacterium]
MRILLPVHHFPPRYSAGAELYTFRLARRLLDQGHRVEVVCVEAIDQGDGQLLVAQDHYEGVPVWRLSFDLFSPQRRRWNHDNPLLRNWFAEYARRERPDLAHFQAGYLLGATPLEALAEAGVPTVLTLHDYWFLCPRITLLRGDGSVCPEVPHNPTGCAWCIRQEQRRVRLPDRLSGGLLGAAARTLPLLPERHQIAERRAHLLPALRLPAAVIAPSHFLARWFAPYVPAERLRVLRLGLDLAPFQAQPRPPRGPALAIGYVGQIAPHKGLHLLVEAFRTLRPAAQPLELHIHGGLEAQPAYAAQVRALAGDDPRIHFHGRFENRRVAAILAGLDLTVVPSTWYENSPLAILEAQAAGTPVVASALGGMAELVRDGVDGLHFAPGDPRDLARQLQRLIDQPELLAQLQRGVVPPTSIEAELEQLLAIYGRVSGVPQP